MKNDDEYPGETRYGSRIFRCAIHKSHGYTIKKINNYPNYYFGIKRNGLYAFTGYLWPYNIYKEDQAELPNGTPLVSPPQPGQDSSFNNFRMMANGMPTTRVHAPYAKYQLNLSLFCTFGWTTNDAYDYHSLDITVYDQYGNSCALAVDPTLLPSQYVDPAADDGLNQLTYFSNATATADTSDNTAHVNLKIVAREKDTEKEYYIQVQEDAEDCIPELFETSASNPPATTEYNLFRFYRNDSGSPDGTRLNSQLTYNIINYHYKTVYFGVSNFTIITQPVFNMTDPGWRMIPIWTNNSIAIYRDDSAKYLSIKRAKGKMSLFADSSTEPQADLEWAAVVESDNTYDGPVDKGAGYDESIYDIPNPTSGRNSWVGVSDVQMTLYGPGSTQAGYIYPNGLNQASIKVQISPTDVKGTPLTNETAPTIEYVKSVVSAIDYYSLVALERDAMQPGWAYSFDSNCFAKHTQSPEAIAVDWDSFTISQNDAGEAKVNFEIYVTCDSNISAMQKLIGLKIAIWDEAWGDPIVYTCSEKPAGGNAMNFNSYVELHTKSPIEYNTDDLDFISTSLNDATQQDDNWPLNPSGRDPDSNMWRLWHYRLALKPGKPAIKFCAVDTNRYNSSNDGNTSCFEKRYSGLYMSEAWLWPTNLVDYNFAPIKDSDITLFTLGNYNKQVSNTDLNKNGEQTIYMSIYYEFGTKSYNVLSVQNYFNIKLYDAFGNSGYFHPNTGCIPYTYDKTEMPSIQLLDNGSTISENLYASNKGIYFITTMDPSAGSDKYTTLGDYIKKKTIFNANINQGNGIHSMFLLEEAPAPNFNWRCYAESEFYLAHGYSDWLLFAGKLGTERFLFFFKPVWSKRGFLMCTLFDGDEGRAFAYTGGNSKNCELVPIVQGDVSFIWTTEANDPDSSPTASPLTRT